MAWRHRRGAVARGTNRRSGDFLTASIATGQTVLVVGGGISGTTAALEAAECGREVILVERSPTLGGRTALRYRYLARICHPTCGLEINLQRLKGSRRVRRPFDTLHVTDDATSAVLQAIRAVENAALGRAAHPRAERFRLRDGRGERFATLVAVENDAILQAAPSGIRYPAPCQVFLWPHKIPSTSAAPCATTISAARREP